MITPYHFILHYCHRITELVFRLFSCNLFSHRHAQLQTVRRSMKLTFFTVRMHWKYAIKQFLLSRYWFSINKVVYSRQRGFTDYFLRSTHIPFFSRLPRVILTTLPFLYGWTQSQGWTFHSFLLLIFNFVLLCS